MRMRQLIVICLLGLGCMPKAPPPPAAPVPRPETHVAVSFGHTWDAVIAHFAANSIPIATIDRSSGLIVTSPLFVGVSDAIRWAWCGWESASNYKQSLKAEWLVVGPSSATYNVLVRGDSVASTLRVTTRWIAPIIPSTRGSECISRDVFEPTLEQALKSRAESGK